MRKKKGAVALAATDLANHLACRHLVHLDLDVAHGRRDAPTWTGGAIEALRRRGLEHEERYLDHLRSTRREVTELGEATGFADTVAAMQRGDDVLAQARLEGGRWSGIADVLLRVEVPSALGGWSYEVVDTKLARETKGGTVLQLCLYAELVAEVQGGPCEHVHVVSPGRGFRPETFRVADYAAYHAWLKRRLEEAVAADAPATTYPEPVPHCEVCRWRGECDERRRDDDHLSLVAGVRREQRAELVERGVDTLAGLARLPLPLEWRPRRGSPEGYARVREQARVQLAGREADAPVHEVLPLASERGLARLPEPSPGDVFFDLESDRYVEGGGLEYLFGYVTVDDGAPVFTSMWARSRTAEKEIFELFVDFLVERRRRWPDLHVYHFAPYERAALTRLMGRHATREDEVDDLLRNHVLVDLHAVAKEAVRCSVESYSLKALEPFFGFERGFALEEANAALRRVQFALEMDDEPLIDPETSLAVEMYNRDDCLSTLALREWLEELRDDRLADGEAVPRPVHEPKPRDEADERRRDVRALVAALLDGVPADPAERDEEQAARALLAGQVEFHWREEKVAWQEHYRRREALLDALEDDREVLVRPVYDRAVGRAKRSRVFRFTFERQEATFKVGTRLRDRDGRYLGTVEGLDAAAGWIDLKASRDAFGEVPDAFFGDRVVGSGELAAAVRRLAEDVRDRGVDAGGPQRAARDLLLRRAPRRSDPGEPLRRDDEAATDAARRLVRELDHGLLPIQGPPGAGKTYTGARMVVEAVRAGLRVGVTALSHKAIRNLLGEVVAAAREAGVELAAEHRVRASEDAPDGVREVYPGRDEFLASAVAVKGATAWTWAAAEEPAVDLLFVDEAGQLSLATTLAVAGATRSLVLLGDPQQLQQPQRGAHPEGADVSALEHVLGGDDTLPADRGLFLETTWRLHPALCAPLSHLYYDGRMRAEPTTAGQRLRGVVGAPRLRDPETPGLRFVAAESAGCRNASPEEAALVAELFGGLVREGATWVDREGEERPLRVEDVLVVAPYNAQVALLTEALPAGARVGTVDRFQGQEAPVVLYSLTTSHPSEAPRGLDFLLSPNRLNVALSRAQVLAVLVANPALFEAECRTPRELRLLNGICHVLAAAGDDAHGRAA